MKWLNNISSRVDDPKTYYTNVGTLLVAIAGLPEAQMFIILHQSRPGALAWAAVPGRGRLAAIEKGEKKENL